MFTQKSSLMLLWLLAALVWGITACGGQEAAPPQVATPTTPAESAPSPAKTADTPTLPPPIKAETPVAAVKTNEAATVAQVAQLLNLSKLDLPDQSKLMGQAEIGWLNYETTQDVKTVADFYRSLLTGQGWQEVSGQGYMDDTLATIYFTKDGFAVSLSASQSGTGSVSVTVMHHGNIDPTTLPQMADAEGVIPAPNTLIYFSPTAVADVAEFTRQELAAQGWQEYVRPNIASANNADSQALSFKQNGLDLSAYITTAPAQDGKTSVQYNLTLLPLDLPTPAEATALELEKSEPYLSFTTPVKPEDVVAFYRQEMTGLGWKELADSTIAAEQASLVFANEPEELVLALAAKLEDGQTTVVLGSLEAVALATQPTPEPVESPTTETTIAESPSSGGDMPNLPTPDDAQNLEYDSDSAQITYTSPSDIAALVKFYREALPPLGWQENEIEGIVTDIFGYLSFSKGEANLTINLTGDVINEGTTVTLDVSDLAPPQEIAATSEPAESVPPADGPTYTIKDWPVPPEAEKVKLSGDKLSYVVAWKLPAIAEFYRPTFEMMGLGTSCIDKADEYTSVSCSSSDGTLSLNFFAFEGFDDQSEVEIEFTNAAMPSSDSGGTEAGGESGDSGQLTAEDMDGLPVPDNHTSLSSEGSPYNRILIFSSPSDVDTLSAFYQTELVALGWELQEVTGSGQAATLAFTGPDGELTVDIKSSGDETETTLKTRNPAAAAKAGILPPAGQARLYMVNFSSEELTVTINNQEVKVKAEAGLESPDDSPNMDLPPGSYKVTIKAGGNIATAQVEVGADQVWALLLGPDGGEPLQMY
jgi:hypothetical protein